MLELIKNYGVVMNPLLALTEQELFNQAVEGLATQNWERSIDPEDEYDDLCAYNDGAGSHCALGWIDPNIPESAIPGSKMFDDYLGKDSHDRSEDYDNRISFLRGLQDCHDVNEKPSEMVENLASFAEKKELSFPNCLQTALEEYGSDS